MKLLNHVRYKLGKGKAVVFIHGIEQDGSFWYPIDRAASEFRKVITIDLLGYGKSPHNDALTYNLAEHVEALKNTLAQEKMNKSFTLVAHSLGCYIALEYAKLQPHKVERLILVSPVIIDQASKIKPRDSFEMLQGAALTNVGLMRAGLLKRYVSKKSSKSYRSIIKTFWPSIKNIENLVENQDIPGQIVAIKDVPVEIIYGLLDPLVMTSEVEALKGLNKNLHIKQFPVGHDLPHDMPSKFLKELIPEVTPENMPKIVYKKRKVFLYNQKQ